SLVTRSFRIERVSVGSGFDLCYFLQLGLEVSLGGDEGFVVESDYLELAHEVIVPLRVTSGTNLLPKDHLQLVPALGEHGGIGGFDGTNGHEVVAWEAANDLAELALLQAPHFHGCLRELAQLL